MIVLVVDDEPAILLSTSLLLEGMGHTVHGAARADEVLELVERHRPDVLLQDVRMPGLDLAKLMEAVRLSPAGKDMRVVLFSAGMDLQDVAASLDVDRVLEKPFKVHELAALLAA